MLHRVPGSIVRAWLTPWLVIAFCSSAVVTAAETFPPIDDRPREIGLHTPDWFQLSFLDLAEDLEDAVARGRQGLAIYFGMDNCPYCEAMFERNLALPDIRQYFSDHFDVIAIDVQGSRMLTTLSGRTMSERQFAIERRLNFTPSFTFFDAEGNEIHRIRGYYPPYRFRAALEYVIDRHDREGSFSEYLARADPPPKFEMDDINQRSFFAPAPHMLDRSRFRAQRPLAVFFERNACHACDILHSEPLTDPDVLRFLLLLDNVQLDLDADTPVITPSGQRTTARQWARDLDVHWAPSILFFDEGGEEIIRIDSVVGLSRLGNVLDYVLTRGYEEFPTFERWRAQRAAQSAAGEL